MKIGIFDSGFGGLTIYKSIRELLPEYDYVYLGDNARTPYGNRSFAAIFQFTKQCLDILVKEDCKLIVIACNTASAKALRTIQQTILPVEYPDRKILGIIRPSAEALASTLTSTLTSSQTSTSFITSTLKSPAALVKNNLAIAPKNVALWATEGTVKSNSFVLELEKLAPQLKLIQQACPMLVPLVEANELTGEGIDYFIKKYWQATVYQNPSIETLLLACTHYPLLYEKIRAAVPPKVQILVQGEIVAASLADYLHRHREVTSQLSQNGQQKFLTTDQTEGFDQLAKVFLGQSVVSEKVEI